MLKASAQTIGLLLAGVTGLPIVLFFLTDENSRVVARVRDERGNRLPVVRKDLKELELVPGVGEEGWALKVPYRPRETWGWLKRSRGQGPRTIVRLDGSPAVRAAGHILPRINSFGGTQAEVKNAVELIEHVGDPNRLFAEASHVIEQSRFTLMDSQTRLALEMAAHEESERRAFEGELEALEAAWREAEEIAAIADRLLTPAGVDDWISDERRKLRPRS